jgi:hypothetical protein
LIVVPLSRAASLSDSVRSAGANLSDHLPANFDIFEKVPGSKSRLVLSFRKEPNLILSYEKKQKGNCSPGVACCLGSAPRGSWKKTLYSATGDSIQHCRGAWH